MANTIKQSSQDKQSTQTLKATESLQIFNKLTLKNTSVPGFKARRSVYQQKANRHTLEGQDQHSQPSATTKHIASLASNPT